MLLAIDAGNTNIVFAVYDGDKIRAQWRAVTQVSRTADEYGVLILSLFGMQKIEAAEVTSVIISSVVRSTIGIMSMARAALPARAEKCFCVATIQAHAKTPTTIDAGTPSIWADCWTSTWIRPGTSPSRNNGACRGPSPNTVCVAFL